MRYFLLLVSLLSIWSCVDNDYNPYIQTNSQNRYSNRDSSYTSDSLNPIKIVSGNSKYYANYQYSYGAFYFLCAAGDSFRLKISNSNLYYGLSFSSYFMNLPKTGIFDSLIIHKRAEYDSIVFYVYRNYYMSYSIDLSFNHNSWENYKDDSAGGSSYTMANKLDTGLTDSLIFKTADWYKFSVERNSFVIATVRNNNDFYLSLYGSNEGPTLMSTGYKDRYFISTRKQYVYVKADYNNVFTVGELPVYYNLYFQSLPIPDSVSLAPANPATVNVGLQRYENLFVKEMNRYSYVAIDSGRYSITYSDMSNYGLAGIISLSQSIIQSESKHAPYENTATVNLRAGETLMIYIGKSSDLPTPFNLSISKDN